jgi:hypothetical protein
MEQTCQTLSNTVDVNDIEMKKKSKCFDMAPSIGPSFGIAYAENRAE